MKVLNKLEPKVNYIAIEVIDDVVVRLNFKEAEKLYDDLQEALYDTPKDIVKNEEGIYVYE